MKYRDDMSAEEHSAWWDSLSDEQKMIAYVPSGYKHILLAIALTKRVLTTCKMKAGEKLQVLEKLNGLTDGYITPEMLAMIEPMSDTEYEMLNEARSLDQPDDKAGRASFDVLTSPDVFEHFVRLNPSLLAAIKFHNALWGRTSRSDPARI
jgi:hypothetical protein